MSDEPKFVAKTEKYNLPVKSNLPKLPSIPTFNLSELHSCPN